MDRSKRGVLRRACRRGETFLRGVRMYAMARFPTRDAAVMRLAKDVCNGSRAHPEVCVGSPVTVDQIERAITACDWSRERALDVAALATRATAEHNPNRKVLVDCVQRQIKHLENVAGNDPAKLQAGGWGERREATPRPAPGQVVGLQVVREGTDSVSLEWKQPFYGGPVKAYRILRRRR